MTKPSFNWWVLLALALSGVCAVLFIALIVAVVGLLAGWVA